MNDLLVLFCAAFRSFPLMQTKIVKGILKNPTIMKVIVANIVY